MALGIAVALLASGVAAAPVIQWTTVVNNNDLFPGDTRNFNSYNQPSVNDAGLVVLRGRTTGGGGGGTPATGILTRDMSTPGSTLDVVASRTTIAPVPQPVPPGVTPTGSTFNEFPAIPRIDSGSSTVVTRGQTQPTLIVPAPTLADPTATTRVGTSGIYTSDGTLISGIANIGNVAGYSQLSVPNTTPGIKFDQFPGAPSVTGGSTIVFKGNWTDATGAGQTGVYWRDTSDPANPVVRIADSTMSIPGTAVNFGSTAPPSAADGKAVFLGVDNEANPTLGGIYMAPLLQNPALQGIVSIGDVAPGFNVAGEDNHFTRIGEALSFDGRYLAFWGGIGTDTRAVSLACPSDGNQSVISYCNDEYPNGFDTTVPFYQGIFVADTLTGSTTLAASTWGSDGFTDFVYWGFTGRPPGVGGGDEAEEGLELARWRSTNFLAVDDGKVAFKGTKGDLFGLFLFEGIGQPLSTIAVQGGDGTLIDPEAVAPDGTPLPITALGIERDGFRNGWLAISASMGNDEASMAGVYVAQLPEPASLPLLLCGLALLWLGSARVRRSS